MFGTLRIARSHPDESLYQAHFCGLCHSLAAFGGKLASLLSNYDTTFWLLVLSALEAGLPQGAGPPSSLQQLPCTAWPWRRVGVMPLTAASRQLVAALTLSLVGAKVDDDLSDGDRRWTAWAFWPLRPAWSRAQAALQDLGFPCEIFQELGRRQSWLEAQLQASLDELAQPTQAMLAQLFGHLAQHCQQPGTRPALEQLGRALGDWIYCYDASRDRLRDARTGAFNALRHCGIGEQSLAERLYADLREASSALEQLPLGASRSLLQAHIQQLYRLTRRETGWRQPSVACEGADCSGCEGCEGCEGCCECCECCEPCAECKCGDRTCDCCCFKKQPPPPPPPGQVGKLSATTPWL